MRPKKSKPVPSEPDSSESLYIRATEEEESGDRWLGSDLAKALRFYQRAYSLYLESIKLQQDYLDSRYNVSRLLFYVYENFVKNDAVLLDEFENCDEALAGGAASVVRPLDQIISVFQESIQIAESVSAFPWDLYYNAVLCFQDFIEDLEKSDNQTFGDIVSCAVQSVEYLEKILEYQVKELESLTTGSEIEQPTQQQEYETQEEAILPSTALESCATAYRIIGSVYDSAKSEHEKQTVESQFGQFVLIVDQIVAQLTQSYSSSNLLPPLSPEDLTQVHYARLGYESSKANNFETLVQIWNTDMTLEKLLLENESYRTFLDKSALSPVELRTVLAAISSRYKQGFDLLKSEFDNSKRNLSASSHLGSTIAQICSILIERADIDLERSKLDVVDEKSRSILASNANKLLRNAITYAQMSGGLRESALEKLARRKKLKEASTRLCLLEGKDSTEELDKIVGATFWPRELAEIRELGIY